MSEKVNNGGPSPDGGGTQTISKTGNEYSHVAGRPAPINTSVTRGVNVPSLTATTASSSGYSPSDKASSSVQYTPAISSYSPSIWSAGVGTPMLAADAPESAGMRATPYWETPLASQTGPVAEPSKTNLYPPSAVVMPQGTAPKSPLGAGLQFGNKITNATPAKEASKTTYTAPRDINADNRPAPADWPVHYKGGEDTKPYTITFFDEQGVPVQKTFPLKVKYQPGGGFVGPDGQPVKLPKKAEIRPAGTNKAQAAINAAVPSRSDATTKVKNDGKGTRNTLSSAYEKKVEPVTRVVDVTEQPPLSSDTPKDDASEITPYPMKPHHSLGSQETLVFEEEPNGGNMNIQLKTSLSLFQEAFPGAIAMISTVNPSHFKMGPGSRVVCIKTDHVRNIHWAVQRKMWVTMDKVGERIMRLTEELKDKEDGVFLLFSVNKQKSYCGLAHLQGPWVPGGDIEGWIGAEDGSRTWGTIPITWRFIKNVPYDYFASIKHVHNGQPITNMWNGMHFPFHEGRKVVEIYIKKAHFTNVLCYRADRPYDPFREITFSAQIDPRLKTKPNDMSRYKMGLTTPRLMIHDALTAGEDDASTDTSANRGNQQGTYLRGNWRQERQGAWDAHQTPVPQNRHGLLAGNTNVTPPNFDNLASPSPRPGQRVECIVDEAGNYIPVTPSHRQGTDMTAPLGPSGFTPTQQTFNAYGYQAYPPHDAPFVNMRGRGGYRGSPYGNRGGRGGGRGGHLRGAHSVLNLDNAGMHQPTTAHGMPSALRGAPSFNMPGVTHALMSANVQHADNDHTGNLREGSAVTGGMSHQAFGSTPRASTSVLRDAVSKANLFVPKNAATPNKDISVPPVENTPSHFPGTHHSPVPAGFESSLVGPGGGAVYPTPTDFQATAEEKYSALDTRMDHMHRQIIDVSGRFYYIDHDFQQQKKEIKQMMQMMPNKVKSSPPASLHEQEMCDPKYDDDASSSQWTRWQYGADNENRNISPLCGSDGKALDSSSKLGSPNTKKEEIEAGNREKFLRFGLPYPRIDESSMYNRMAAEVDKLVNSPPTSGETKKAEGEGEGEEMGGGVALE